MFVVFLPARIKYVAWNVIHGSRCRGKQQVLTRDALLGEGIPKCSNVTLSRKGKELNNLVNND